MNNLSKQNQKNNQLQKIVSRLLDNNHLPTRIVVILDKIESLELLENLAQSGLFENDQLSVIAIAHHEDYGNWSRARERLEAIDFKEWYVPCLWQTRNDYMEHIDYVLFQKREDVPQEIVNLLHKHLEFMGKGILGNIIEELKQPRYWDTTEDGTKYLNLEALPQLHTIRHNAWLQDMLSLNWDTILGNLFAGRDMAQTMDRARIGVYYLLDWIGERSIFTRKQLIDASSKRKITISDHSEVIDEIIFNLIYVLEENEYLQVIDSRYRISWQITETRSPRKVEPRSNTNLTTQPEPQSTPAETIIPSPASEEKEENTISLSDLKDKIIRYFDPGEIEALCFDLGIDYGEIKNESKTPTVINLVTYCDRHGIIEELIQKCAAQRPHVSW